MRNEDKAFLADLNLERLYTSTSGRADIRIALIDGPVDTGHIDFQGATISRISGDEETGCYIPGSPACQHGTFVTGVICADRASAAPALCPGCTVLFRPIFCEAPDIEQCPVLTADDLADVLREVMDEDVSIINMSVGVSGGTGRQSPKLIAAFDEARRRNVLLIGASGNQGLMDVNALFRHPWVIPVAGCRHDGSIEASSNIGIWVSQHGLLAPGAGVFSTAAGGGYRRMSGTSVAAPFVTGVAALLWSLYPDTTAEELHHALLRSDRPRTSVLPLMIDAEASWEILENNSRSKRVNISNEVIQTMSEQVIEQQTEVIHEEVLPQAVADVMEYKEDTSTAIVSPQGCTCGGLGGICSCGSIAADSQSYIYAVGVIKPLFPSLDLQKEFDGAAKQLKVSERDYYSVFSADGQPYMYIAEKMCWILTINNIDAYIVVPRSQLELNDIINALKPPANSVAETLSVVLGLKGPVAPAEYCNGLQLPMVLCNQLYFFTLDDLLGNLTGDDIDTEAIKDVINTLEFKPNDGAADADRAINYLAFRYPEIYRKTASLKKPASSSTDSRFLVDVTTKSSGVSSGRSIIDVIFKFQSNTTGEINFWYCSVDVTGQFPFLSSPLQTYVPIS